MIWFFKASARSLINDIKIEAFQHYVSPSPLKYPIISLTSFKDESKWNSYKKSNFESSKLCL